MMSYEPREIVKTVLLGKAESGKTTFLNQYIHKKFTKDYVATIGVDFVMKVFTAGGRDVALQLWDTAGDERFMSQTSIYMRNVDVIILTIDSADIGKSVDYLSYHQSEFTEDIQFVVMFTKSHRPKKDGDMTPEGAIEAVKKFDGVTEENLHYHKVNSKEKTNAFLEVNLQNDNDALAACAVLVDGISKTLASREGDVKDDGYVFSGFDEKPSSRLSQFFITAGKITLGPVIVGVIAGVLASIFPFAAATAVSAVLGAGGVTAAAAALTGVGLAFTAAGLAALAVLAVVLIFVTIVETVKALRPTDLPDNAFYKGSLGDDSKPFGVGSYGDTELKSGVDRGYDSERSDSVEYESPYETLLVDPLDNENSEPKEGLVSDKETDEQTTVKGLEQ